MIPVEKNIKTRITDLHIKGNEISADLVEINYDRKSENIITFVCKGYLGERHNYEDNNRVKVDMKFSVLCDDEEIVKDENEIINVASKMIGEEIIEIMLKMDNSINELLKKEQEEQKENEEIEDFEMA